MSEQKKKIVIGVTGASGTIYAIDLIKKLQKIPNIETHGILSAWAKKNLQLETDYSLKDINDMLDYTYNDSDLGAAIASGSFLTDAMVIVPASMKTIASISVGIGDNLISRAADVTLKEQRKLIMVPRETPLNTIHLENMTKLSRMGVQMIPPIPAFYNHPQTIQDLVDHQTMKIMDSLGIHTDDGSRWEGI
ncbi:UbiX family flavin prenyltransferase [Companilactobacillus sp.]|jgi:polyprenyl P-hydroxybenzoate/phenylacrylic acid decarboxylase-like protein|uniref:UbiX family flavin prenyltransferase n=1 Tax=Companilactobacillus sp. TaxID=2767905 RepID=UPI0025C2ED77|nr:UbiX family flavin prenyltransferase [Companilactobacillus sp.]MCH4008682.1 UbiX family flavin prenyltransferase [Companilactobacillus sp.]MCH4051139.1 UbiX family flavin prenyltransferase [Companilactobacillus sp.]MCH4076625.1 UbiX family flavin prenyltransferase [Companilactobacillus sp.]MCH4125200.1 UbiX family flavin prenyltransferase [Companilactobacillus sp.]MCH4131740.1 UbiX family flavin prenyltransferase [Companilactobacillus sp.]